MVHKVPCGGRVYPVISIEGFKGSPYFCGKEFLSSTMKPILMEGAIYIRDAAAKTVVVAGPEHWNSLLRTAVSQRQTELLEYLRSLLGQLGISIPGTTSALDFSSANNPSWYESESKAVRSKLNELHPGAGIFEVMHYPVGASTTWNQGRLVAAAQRAVARNTGWPMGIVMNKPQFAPKPTVFGIRATINAGDRFDYWSLDKSGAYYFLRILDEDTDHDLRRRAGGPWIYFDTRIWRIAETLLHCSNLYRELELPLETVIAIRVAHSGLKDRLLGVANPMRMMHWNRKCEEDEIIWSKAVVLGSIEATLEDLTREAAKELFMVFEFWEPSDQVFSEIFNEFSRSKV